MKILFFEEIPSTQEHLKQNLTRYQKEMADPHILVCCNKQTQGHGRRGNEWTHFEDSLAVSFSLKKDKEFPLTLYPLKMAMMVREALHLINPIWDIKLKWPNDIINSKGEKLGGIICQVIEDSIVFGLGLNFANDDLLKPQIDTPYGYNFLRLTEVLEKQKMAEILYTHII